MNVMLLLSFMEGLAAARLIFVCLPRFHRRSELDAVAAAERVDLLAVLVRLLVDGIAAEIGAALFDPHLAFLLLRQPHAER